MTPGRSVQGENGESRAEELHRRTDEEKEGEERMRGERREKEKEDEREVFNGV